ncbi:MAG: TRAP transporter small permease subunit [Truepera sp.]|nr:TRAP transporter small permease subunit [Truepera sp.]
MTQWSERFARVEEIIAQAFLALTVGVTFLGGVARFSGRPLDWAMDLATFSFAWAVFLGADVALRHDRHVAVELFANLLPEKVRRGVRLFNFCLIALFLGALLVYSVQMAYLTRFRTFQGIPGISYTWVTLSVTAGSLLLLLTALSRIRREWKSFRSGA